MPFLLFILVFLAQAFAYEVDNLSHREKFRSIPDGLVPLNAQTNKLIAEAVTKANKLEKCSAVPVISPMPKIFAVLKDKLDSNPVAEIEDWAESSNAMPKVESGDDHIYSEKSWWDGIVMSVAGLEPSSKINGHIVGIDKFGHFMAQGFDYYKKAIVQKKGMHAAIKYGLALEQGGYGLESTGVKSYADTAANLAGASFWSSLVGGKNPYLKCVNGQYQIAKSFDWSVYVTDAWDEGINCSSYTRALQKVVSKKLKKLGLTCPINVDQCRALAKMECANFILSPKCLKHISPIEINQSCYDVPKKTVSKDPLCLEPNSHPFPIDNLRVFKPLILNLKTEGKK